MPFASDAQAAQQRLRSLVDPAVAAGSARFFKTGPGMNINVVEGNLLDQEVEVIVNAWNRNIIPWWLLLPQGLNPKAFRRVLAGVPLRPNQERMPPVRPDHDDRPVFENPCGSFGFDGALRDGYPEDT
jgi:hypothetical protein